MPRIERWDNLPPNVRQHLVDRMRDRAISVSDLNQLRLWIDTHPEVPEGDWYTGIRASAHSKSAATAHTPRRSCFRAKLPRVKRSDPNVYMPA